MMNIHVHETGVLLVGKAWEVKARLKQQLKKQDYVTEWVQEVFSSDKQNNTDVDTASKKSGSSAYVRPIVVSDSTSDNARVIHFESTSCSKKQR